MTNFRIKALLVSLIYTFVIFFSPIVYQIAYGAGEKTNAEILFDMGILKGDGTGNLMESENVTRAEMTAILCRTAGFAESSFADFDDITENHWAYGYISEMTKRGILKGYEDGSFKPENKVTFAEAVKMILGILEVDDNGFSFPEDYMIKGAETSVTEGVEAIHSDYLTREEISKLICNALYIQKTDGTMLSEKLGVNVIYVSQKGNSTGAGTKDNPYSTIEEALSAAEDGSVIFLDEGKYVLEEKLLITNGGINENLPLIITPLSYKNAEIVLKNDAVIEIDENAEFVKLYKIDVNEPMSMVFRRARAGTLLNFYEKMNEPQKMVLQVLKIGDCCIYLMNGEDYVEFQHYLKENSPTEKNLFASNSNGGTGGYVPTKEMADLPNLYEAQIPSSVLLPGEAEKLTEELLQMAKEIF